MSALQVLITTQEKNFLSKVIQPSPSQSSQNSEVNDIKELEGQRKADLAKIEEEYRIKKEELERKIKVIHESAKPLEEKFFEIKKANDDKENEIKIKDLNEKSKNFLDDLELSAGGLRKARESIEKVKLEYKQAKTECNMDLENSFHVEQECEGKLKEKRESIKKALSELSVAFEELKQKYEKVSDFEVELDAAENELWNFIFENRRSHASDFESFYKIYQDNSQIEKEYIDIGIKFDKDKKEIIAKTKNELKKLKPEKYEWVAWRSHKTEIPSNALVGGYDTDSSILFIARMDDGGSYNYGKFSIKRQNVYFANGDSEQNAYDFDLLVGTNFIWCSSEGINSSEISSSDFSVCRRKIRESLTPGTFLSDGRCRIGFGYQTYYYEEDFEVLKQGSC